MSSSSSSSPYSSGRSSPVLGGAHTSSSSRLEPTAASQGDQPSLTTFAHRGSFSHSPASSPYSTSPELGPRKAASPYAAAYSNMSTATQAAPAAIPSSRREDSIHQATTPSGTSYGAYLHHVSSSSPPGSASTSPSFSYLTQYQQNPSSSGAGFRRGSTPASSFLPTRFLGAPNNVHADSFAAQSLLPPRRTSFGTGLGGASGRLGALSALGLAPSPPMPSQSLSSSATTTNERSVPAGVRHSPSTPALPTISSSSPAPVSQPSSPKAPPKPQPKKHVWVLPGPDGLCVETKGRRRRASEAA